MGIKRYGFYAGTFDVFHDGHAEVIRHAEKLFDKVIIGIGINALKTTALTSFAERVEIIEKYIVSRYKNPKFSVVTFSKPLVISAREHGCGFIVRGLRNHDDFGDEMLLKTTNEDIEKTFGVKEDDLLETIWVPTRLGTSSTLLRQLMLLDDYRWFDLVKRYVPVFIWDDIFKIASREREKKGLRVTYA